MVTTDDPALCEAMWSFKDHGKSWQAMHTPQAAQPPGFRWLHTSFGTNWRMLEMQAAIGSIQLRRMSDWSSQRRRNAERLAKACGRFDAVRVPEVPLHSRHAYYKFYAFVRPEKLAAGWSRDRIVQEIVARGVPCYHGTCPEVYLEKAFDESPARPRERLPVARELGETSLMFLVHPTLTSAEIEKTCSVLGQVLEMASA